MGNPSSSQEQVAIQAQQNQRDLETLRRAVTNFDALLAQVDSLARPEQIRALGIMLARLADKLERVSSQVEAENKTAGHYPPLKPT